MSDAQAAIRYAFSFLVRTIFTKFFIIIVPTVSRFGHRDRRPRTAFLKYFAAKIQSTFWPNDFESALAA